MTLLYSLGLLGAIILASPYWLFRMMWSGRYRDGLGERLGLVPRGLREFIVQRPTVWVHAVSVGEVVAASRLIELLDGINLNLPVVISTTTQTGQAMAHERFDTKPQTVGTQDSASRVFYYPLDFRWIVRRYLRMLRPRILVLMESELWPRMLMEAHRANIPVVVANGRISDRSLPRYRTLRWFWRSFLRKLTLVMAQSEQDRQRFIDIGAAPDSVKVAGNLKYDVRTPQESVLATELRAHLPKGAKVIVAGSTLQGEETCLLQAFRELLPQFPELVLILAPRHPERFPSVEKLIQEAQFLCIRRSAWGHPPATIPGGTVFLLDSMGELVSIYSLASVAFVGGSLVPAGGHNPLEPAQFAVPIVMGPYTENFRGMVAILLQHEAIRVTPPERLHGVLSELLTSPAAAPMGARARQVFEEHAGASQQCFAAILNILEGNAFPEIPPAESK
ncbi:MAG: 3-deoxy-D-manno-octulosonic acid transferase [Acidobacteriaceae bacterium]